MADDIAKRRQRHRARIAASEWLRETFPLLFGWPQRPLALGIGVAIWVAAKDMPGRPRAKKSARRWPS
jgi:hypothetical protein